jgi:hypothetical protein
MKAKLLLVLMKHQMMKLLLRENIVIFLKNLIIYLQNSMVVDSLLLLLLLLLQIANLRIEMVLVWKQTKVIQKNRILFVVHLHLKAEKQIHQMKNQLMNLQRLVV